MKKSTLVLLVPRHNWQLLQLLFLVNTLFLKYEKDQRKGDKRRQGPFPCSVNQITTAENENVTLEKKKDYCRGNLFSFVVRTSSKQISGPFSHIQWTANICSSSVRHSRQPFLTKLIPNMSYFHTKKGLRKLYKGLLRNKKGQRFIKVFALIDCNLSFFSFHFFFWEKQLVYKNNLKTFPPLPKWKEGKKGK